jgi:hypothetical protein
MQRKIDTKRGDNDTPVDRGQPDDIEDGLGELLDFRSLPPNTRSGIEWIRIKASSTRLKLAP